MFTMEENLDNIAAGHIKKTPAHKSIFYSHYFNSRNKQEMELKEYLLVLEAIFCRFLDAFKSMIK